MRSAAASREHLSLENVMSVSPQQAARAAALSDEVLLLECEEQFFIASGPGGQHRNKTETGVRLIHKPTGFTVTATERRSQLQNRGAALERLRGSVCIHARPASASERASGAGRQAGRKRQ